MPKTLPYKKPKSGREDAALHQDHGVVAVAEHAAIDEVADGEQHQPLADVAEHEAEHRQKPTAITAVGSISP